MKNYLRVVLAFLGDQGWNRSKPRVPDYTDRPSFKAAQPDTRLGYSWDNLSVSKNDGSNINLIHLTINFKKYEIFPVP